MVFGEIVNDSVKNLKDISKNEYLVLTPLLIMTLVLGFYPNLVLDLISASVDKVTENINVYLKVTKALN